MARTPAEIIQGRIDENRIKKRALWERIRKEEPKLAELLEECKHQKMGITLEIVWHETLL